jgi:hypothetical protein
MVFQALLMRIWVSMAVAVPGNKEHYDRGLLLDMLSRNASKSSALVPAIDGGTAFKPFHPCEVLL